MQSWKTVDRRTLLEVDNGRFLKVEAHKIELPDGRVIENWPWLVMPEFVNVVARTQQGDFICFRQTKYAAPGISLAIVGGYLDEGEEPLTAAKRELLEETGYSADRWESLGSFAIDGNRGAGTCHLFLADQAQPTRPIAGGDLEEQEMLLLHREQLEIALLQGEFKIVTWSAAISMALLRLQTT